VPPSGADRPGAPARPDVTVLTTGHDVADARLHRVVAALARHGMAVEVLGLGDAAAGPPDASTRAVPRRGLLSRAGSALVRPWQAHGRVTVVLDPDLVPVARLRRMVRRHEALVVDVHEDYARVLDDRSWAAGVRGTLARGVVALSTRAAAGADLTVVADAHVPPLHARHRLVVRNLPDTSMLPSPAGLDPSPRALYVGDVRASRGLWAMVATVERAPRWTVDVIGPVASSDQERLDRWLGTSPHASRLRLLGRRPPQESWAAAAGAWVGLSLLEATPAFVEALPSKLFEYRACGLAVIATDLPRQSAWVQQQGTGAVVAAGPAEQVGAAVAELLEAWADDPSAVLAARAAAAEVRAEPNEYDLLAEGIAALLRRGPDAHRS
jgi:glycosyltransferase involved in cell wall biosynthesis